MFDDSLDLFFYEGNGVYSMQLIMKIPFKLKQINLGCLGTYDFVVPSENFLMHSYFILKIIDNSLESEYLLSCMCVILFGGKLRHLCSDFIMILNSGFSGNDVLDSIELRIYSIKLSLSLKINLIQLLYLCMKIFPICFRFMNCWVFLKFLFDVFLEFIFDDVNIVFVVFGNDLLVYIFNSLIQL